MAQKRADCQTERWAKKQTKSSQKKLGKQVHWHNRKIKTQNKSSEKIIGKIEAQNKAQRPWKKLKSSEKKLIRRIEAQKKLKGEITAQEKARGPSQRHQNGPSDQQRTAQSPRIRCHYYGGCMVRRQIALRVAQTFKTRLRNRNLSTTRVIPVGNRGAKECDGAVELDAATADARIEKKKQVALRKNRSKEQRPPLFCRPNM